MIASNLPNLPNLPIGQALVTLESASVRFGPTGTTLEYVEAAF